MKESLISYVDSDCTKILREMANWIKDIYNIIFQSVQLTEL
ncbi:hypothetical protein H311_00854 [Anncaliia algerae PRA109]|nr:hypothetical protein H311_00854 [Anncaliia algerae PRA109]